MKEMKEMNKLKGKREDINKEIQEKKNKLLIWLNDNILPISYKLWKEDQDETYVKIAEDLKQGWVDVQISIYSGLIIPLIIFILGLIAIDNPSSKFGVIVRVILIIYILVVIFLVNHHYDKYTDEKYLDMSEQEFNKNKEKN